MAFTLPGQGVFEWNALPAGLIGASEIFHEIIRDFHSQAHQPTGLH